MRLHVKLTFGPAPASLLFLLPETYNWVWRNQIGSEDDSDRTSRVKSSFGLDPKYQNISASCKQVLMYSQIIYYLYNYYRRNDLNPRRYQILKKFERTSLAIQWRYKYVRHDALNLLNPFRHLMSKDVIRRIIKDITNPGYSLRQTYRLDDPPCSFKLPFAYAKSRRFMVTIMCIITVYTYVSYHSLGSRLTMLGPKWILNSVSWRLLTIPIIFLYFDTRVIGTSQY